MISRREWLRASLVAGGGLSLARALGGQQQQQPAGIQDTSNLFPMDQSAARSVRLPPKPGASASMSQEERDALEHRIRCQCGCTLDVFTCRTTDFSCQVSPSMHRDVVAMVQGGYSAQEILDSFVNAYGERVLMAPPKVGFNRLGYVVPGFALAIGAVLLAVKLRRWNKVPAPRAALFQSPATPATADELARLEAAVRDDS